MSSYELDIASSLGSADLAKEYVRMRKQWSREFSLELVRIYRKISRLEEEVEKLHRELDRFRAQSARPAGDETRCPIHPRNLVRS
jgi:hypothetical protein